MEEALHDISLYREFARLDLGATRLPDESTILRFRHLLESNNLSLQVLATINATLASKGLLLKTGTVVDATLIAASSSTKNKDGQRDPEMHQANKTNQWRIIGGHPDGWRTRAHIGADAELGSVHTVIGTSANVNDVTQGHALLHAQETIVSVDAGYQGTANRGEATGVQWHVAMRPGKRKAQKHTLSRQLAQQADKLKANVRAKVEHAFRAINCQFGFAKVRYKGLTKNTAQLITLFTLFNLWMARRALLQRIWLYVCLLHERTPQNSCKNL